MYHATERTLWLFMAVVSRRSVLFVYRGQPRRKRRLWEAWRVREREHGRERERGACACAVRVCACTRLRVRVCVWACVLGSRALVPTRGFPQMPREPLTKKKGLFGMGSSAT